jgi:hypothetical protein
MINGIGEERDLTNSPTRHVANLDATMPASRTLLLLALLLLPQTARAAELESPHFRIEYNSELLSREKAEEARGLAERGWEKCAHLFGSSPAHKIRLNLTPDFTGATGFARPGDLKSADPRRASLVAVRYADLDYLGIGDEYVLTHEIAHVFCGKLAGTALGEGIADWATGFFEGIPMAPWWGVELRRAGLWVDPDALFITGDYDAPEELDPRTRAAEYSESALLVRFLVEEYGWSRFATFAERYADVRRSLRSNGTERGARGGWSPFERQKSGQPAPDAARVRRVFEETLGRSWEELRTRWEAQMAADHAPEGEAARLVLGEEIYGSIRNYELWVLRHERQAPAAERQAIRRAFTEANQAMAAGDLKLAEERLRAARARVRALQRPMDVTAVTCCLAAWRAGEARLRAPRDQPPPPTTHDFPGALRCNSVAVPTRRCRKTDYLIEGEW